ncbi:MAG TPA: hypothetical protein VGL39_12810 [Jatrophihabitantaceae bacterium]
MLLIGLLLAALACLVVGLLMANAVWLIASLVASAVAGYVLWHARDKIGTRADAKNDEAAPKSATGAKPQSLVTGSAFIPNADAAAANTEQRVWVVDGRPQFHAESCAAIRDLDPEPIPLAQALGDGFTQCTACSPDASATTLEQVFVVDGRPDYHVQDCRSLKIAAGQSAGEADEIPRAQAVEDGFSPCPDCRPDGSAPADTPTRAAQAAQAAEPAAADASGSVWVVDGRPRYHLADCMIIKDQEAEEISLEQAAEDGFMACSMCEPNVTRV